MTQESRVLSYLKQHKTITQGEAYTKLAIGRLSARIHRLRAAGEKIETEMRAVKNRFGDTCHVAFYKLKTK